MQKHTHIAFGLALGLAAESFLNIEPNLIEYGAGILAGSLLPDIDHPSSSLGRKVPVLSHVVSMLFKHRTFTHSIVFVLLVALFAYPYLSVSMFHGLMVGIISHILGDMLTNRGVKVFYPLGGFISFPLTFKTGGVMEQAIFLVLSFYVSMNVISI